MTQVSIPTLLLAVGGYYFYALLDADDGLIDVVGYIHFGQGYPPCLDQAIASHVAACPQTKTVLTGQVAKLLYTAITGRLRSEDPHQATAQKALGARMALMCLPDDEDTRHAIRCLANLGNCYWPWHGATKTTREGRLIWDDPDYHRLIPIADEITLPEAMAGETFTPTML
jgi:hypothetical protein